MQLPTMPYPGPPLRPGDSARPASPHIVLIGAMGCGKTTVGQLVAARLGRPFVDNDVALEAATGATARRIEEEFGTTDLHRRELGVFGAALRGDQPAVIAAAASVVDSVTIDDVASHLVVYVHCTAPVGARRSVAGRHRPDIRSTAQAQARRDRRCRALADMVIDVDELDAVAAADRIAVVDLTALSRRLP